MASGSGVAARRASRGGLFGRRLGVGLTRGAVTAVQELDALGDHVNPGGVAAVLALELLDLQAPVDRDLAPAFR